MVAESFDELVIVSGEVTVAVAVLESMELTFAVMEAVEAVLDLLELASGERAAAVDFVRLVPMFAVAAAVVVEDSAPLELASEEEVEEEDSVQLELVSEGKVVLEEEDSAQLELVSEGEVVEEEDSTQLELASEEEEEVAAAADWEQSGNEFVVVQEEVKHLRGLQWNPVRKTAHWYHQCRQRMTFYPSSKISFQSWKSH